MNKMNVGCTPKKDWFLDKLDTSSVDFFLDLGDPAEAKREQEKTRTLLLAFGWKTIEGIPAECWYWDDEWNFEQERSSNIPDKNRDDQLGNIKICGQLSKQEETVCRTGLKRQLREILGEEAFWKNFLIEVFELLPVNNSQELFTRLSSRNMPKFLEKRLYPAACVLEQKGIFFYLDKMGRKKWNEILKNCGDSVEASIRIFHALIEEYFDENTSWVEFVEQVYQAIIGAYKI